MSKSCPTCDKKIPTQDNPYKPFCSERCRLLDLGNWVDGKYRIPEKEGQFSGEEGDLLGQASSDHEEDAD